MVDISIVDGGYKLTYNWGGTTLYNPLTTRTALPSTADRPLNKVLPHFLIEVGEYNILGFRTREHGTGTLENLHNIRQ